MIDVKTALSQLGYAQPTPIQTEAIPLLLQGRDLIGQSQTGSGKTVAFGLPLIHAVDIGDRTLQSLVLCPTRELCTQVARELRKLGRHLPGLQVQILAGGQPLRAQVAAMTNGIHIAVATPGRLLDHLRRNTVTLAHIKRLVLDEADRMLDMGFEEDILEIVALTPKNRQTVFFSATVDANLEAMSRRLQRSPVRISIAEEVAEPLKIQQTFYQFEGDKSGALTSLLNRLNPLSALVFCRLKASAAGLAEQLRESGLSAAALHGDLDQHDRDRALAQFRNHSARILVATDVAARGLDILDLDLVVNFDLPTHPEMYLHRIGRTGRAGKTGLAISLGSLWESAKLEAYEKLTGSSIERVVYEEGEPNEVATVVARMSTLHIWGGRKDKMRPGDILGALTGDIGLPAAEVGVIEIHDRLSYVAVPAHLARQAARRLRDGHIKGRKFRVDVVP